MNQSMSAKGPPRSKAGGSQARGRHSASGGKKILIVEDDAILISTLADNLSQAGFGVIKAKDGKEGLVLAFREHPDLILLDIILPKMDGVTMLKKLRQNKKCLAIPVILLTNLSYGKEVEEAIKNGVSDFLVKANWKIEDVMKKVKALT